MLGVAYKRDIDDVRESPALDIIELLHERGAELSYHDPYVPVIKHHRSGKAGVGSAGRTSRPIDCVVIVTDHTAFDYARSAHEAQLVVDTRNATKTIRARLRQQDRLTL